LRARKCTQSKNWKIFFWKFRDFKVVEWSWVTYPEKIKKKGFLWWSYCNGWPTQVKNAKIFQRFFSKWWKMQRFFKVVKNTKIFQSGFIVMGDLPRWKMQGFFKVVKNTEIFQSDLVVMGDLPKWKMKRVFKVVKNTQILQSGEKYRDFSKWSCCNGRPA